MKALNLLVKSLINKQMIYLEQMYAKLLHLADKHF